MIVPNNQLTKNEPESRIRSDGVEREEPDLQVPRFLKWAISPKRHPTLLGHIVLTTSMAVLALVGYWGLFWFAGTREAEWLGTVPQTQPEALDAILSELPATPAERSRLMEQFQGLELRAARHAKIMGFFYKQYYISISMIVASFVLASLCLFFISKAGWSRVNNALINIFICSSAVILLYGNFIFVFKQEENLRGNQELYLSYIVLREEVLSYWATQQISTGQTLEPAQFIHYLDDKLQTLNKIQLGFDSPQISAFIDQFKQIEQPNQPSFPLSSP
ncbi:MAG: hypothetical protein Kow00121_37540 [Elainellaceae cyanobacterium]